MLELGEFVPHDPDQAQDRHVRVAGTDFIYAPELRVCDCTGGGGVADFAAVDLVMTNYNLARGMTGVDFETGGTVVGALVQATWGLLVLDEFSVVANPGTSSFHSVAAIRAQAKRVLLLNATMLENTTVDLWAHLESKRPPPCSIRLRSWFSARPASSRNQLRMRGEPHDVVQTGHSTSATSSSSSRSSRSPTGIDTELALAEAACEAKPTAISHSTSPRGSLPPRPRASASRLQAVVKQLAVLRVNRMGIEGMVVPIGVFTGQTAC